MSQESDAYKEAERRIRAWSPSDDYLDLAIFDLSTIPESIAGLSVLTDLRLRVLDQETNSSRYAAVQSLLPLVSLVHLQTLYCSHTSVSDLSPIKKLSQLQELDISKCQLTDSGSSVWNKKTLRRLVAFESLLPGVPTEVLSHDIFDNCLARLRAHWQDGASGMEPLLDTKLMVLGNGRVGKTQLCRWLRKEPFDESVKSTHGVTVTSIPYASKRDARLHLWDFGGQDIYHSTRMALT